jgi:hypothetical protein
MHDECSFPVRQQQAAERTAAARDAALALNAPWPGVDASRFELLEDADGRFVIDEATGRIELSDPKIAAVEPGAVHPVRIRISNPLGDYEAAFHLRIADRLPVAVLPDGSDPLARFEKSSTPPAGA